MSHGGLRVPYITAWSGEAISCALSFAPHPEASGLRLTYLDPVPTDWIYGVLRARQGLVHGGRPEWRLVNALRQWRCMEHGLCQVCGRSAVDRETGRTWWLLSESEDVTAPESGYANAPPTCRRCIPEAVSSCPRLRRGAAAFLVGDYERYAVLGNTFRPSRTGAELVERNVMVFLEEYQRLESTLAHQLTVLLRDLRPVPLADVLDQNSAPCSHQRIEWTGKNPLPEGASCLECGTWWRVDLVPQQVAERLSGGVPPREGMQHHTTGGTRS